MRHLRSLLALLGAAGLFAVGCERHEFEDTKKLFEGHGAHHDDHGHDEDHGHDAGDHPAGEKPAAPAAGKPAEVQAPAAPAEEAKPEGQPRDLGL